MSVYKKLFQVQKKTRSLGANAEGQTGAAKYNYVSGSKLLSVIRPVMDELGLILTQEVIGITNTPMSYTTQKGGDKTEMFTTAHIRFTWVDTEDGSTLVNDYFANGMNAFDKGLGSALTYAERYYLMKTFHIATDEDDVDALVKEEAIQETANSAVQARKKAAGRAKKQDQPAQVETNPFYTPMAEDEYWKVIMAAANNYRTKQGGDYRSTWIEMTHAGEQEIAKFDHDVQNFKAAHNINN